MSQKTEELKAVSRTTITRRQWIWKEMKKNKVAYLMVAPYMLLFTIFTVLPVVLSAFISFTNFNMIDIAGTEFLFFENYITLFFDDDIFLIACKNTLIFAAIVGPVSYLMSFLVAWFINELSPHSCDRYPGLLRAFHLGSGLYHLGCILRRRRIQLGKRLADGDRYDHRADCMV